MSKYEIYVWRKKTEGTPRFWGPGSYLETTCWWKLDNEIPAKTYTDCSATTMRKKLNSLGLPREAIYIPDEQTGKNGIFIHYGKNASWSDGCIVIVEKEMLKIYKAIKEKNGKNVTVVVEDDPKRNGEPKPKLNYPSGIHFGPAGRCRDF